jgi:hypothetical protein
MNQVPGDLHRLELSIEADDAVDGRLMADVTNAQQRLHAARMAVMRPQFDEGGRQLVDAVLYLEQRLEAMRNLEAKAVRLGVLDQVRTPPITGVNGLTLYHWINGPNAQEAKSAEWAHNHLAVVARERWVRAYIGPPKETVA